MKEYNKMVRDFADQKSEDLIPNSGIEHAEVLIKNLFSHASNEVRILTGSLNARVYGTREVLASVDEFLHSGGNKKIKILLQDVDDNAYDYIKSHPLYLRCKELGESMCEIKFSKDNKDKLQSHFVVIDNNGYRIEPDKSEPIGIGCFNDEETSKKLVDKFDYLFNKGALITPETTQAI
ncbi:MAG: hypothetical protein KAT04_08675 [Methylococcales bacterium]|nr:hypothetical protein [Methylococcales bacterium]